MSISLAQVFTYQNFFFDTKKPPTHSNSSTPSTNRKANPSTTPSGSSAPNSSNLVKEVCVGAATGAVTNPMIRFRDMVTYEKTFSLSQLSRAVKTGYECMHVNAARMSLSIGLVNFLGSFVSSDARPYVTAMGNVCVNTVLETAQNIANTGGKMKLPLSSAPLLLSAYVLRDGAYGYTMGHLTHPKPEESLVLRVAKSVGAGFVVGAITSPAQVAIKDLLYKGCCKDVLATFYREPRTLIPAGLARGFHVAAVISTITIFREFSSSKMG